MRGFLRAALLATAAFVALRLALAAGPFEGNFQLGTNVLHLRQQAAVTLALVCWVISLAVAATLAFWKTHRLAVVLTWASLAAALPIAEVVLRVTLRRAAVFDEAYFYSPTLHHVLPSGATLAAFDMAGRVDPRPPVVRTNADGLRTAYTADEFARHAHRIVVQGDSFAMGFGVDQRFAAPQQLEQLLRHRVPGSDTVVLNAGVLSYSPFLEGLQYQQVIRGYRPGLVFLILDESDIGDDEAYEAERGRGETFPFERFSPFDQPSWTTHSAVVQSLPRESRRLLLSPLDALFARERSHAFPQMIVNGKPTWSRFFIYQYPFEVTRPFYDATLRNISNEARAVEADGGRFVLVIAPRYIHWNRSEAKDNWEAAYYGDQTHRADFLTYFDEAAARVPFKILNLLPALKASSERLCFTADPHWNENGHRVVATALADYTIANRFIEAAAGPRATP